MVLAVHDACGPRARAILQDEAPFRAADFEIVGRCLIAMGLDVEDAKQELLLLCARWDVVFEAAWYELLVRWYEERGT